MNLEKIGVFGINVTFAAGITYGVEAAGGQIVKAKEVMAPLAGRVITPITAFMNETIFPVAAPYIQRGFDAMPSYLQPIFEAIKGAPSTPIAPQVASLTAIGMIVGYKAIQAGTDLLFNEEELINAFADSAQAAYEKGWIPLNKNRCIRYCENVLYVTSHTVKGLQFTIAAAATYYVGLQFGTALTLAQLFKIAGGVAASQILSDFAIKSVKLVATQKEKQSKKADEKAAVPEVIDKKLELENELNKLIAEFNGQKITLSGETLVMTRDNIKEIMEKIREPQRPSGMGPLWKTRFANLSRIEEIMEKIREPQRPSGMGPLWKTRFANLSRIEEIMKALTA